MSYDDCRKQDQEAEELEQEELAVRMNLEGIKQ